MRKYNALNSLMVICFLAPPSVAGTLTTFEAETFSTAPDTRGVTYFTIGTESFLALARSRGNSVLYKWEDSAYTEFQTLRTHDAYEFEFFTLDSVPYLAVANKGRDSVVYQWDGSAFEEYQTISTHQARDWEFFTIGNESFLVVANYQGSGSLNIDSVIYKWGSNEQFEVYQNIGTSGAYDWEFFTIDAEPYLAVANYRDPDYSTESALYRWDGQRFEEFQTIPTNGAFDWEYFTLDGDSFLAVANYYDGSSWETPSVVYKWDGSAFISNQTIATNGATDWEFFTLANEAFLVATNYSGNFAQVFKYDGSIFTSFQSMTATRTFSSTFYTRGTESYLAIANHRGSSALYRAIQSSAPTVPTATIRAGTPCPGERVTLSLEVQGQQPFTYQWYFFGEEIAGATDDTYTITAMGQGDEGDYECHVSNANGTGVTEPLRLTRNPNILYETPPSDIRSCQGKTVTFGLSASGLNLNYQWHYNGTNIAGATQPTYRLENITTANEGAYTCEISDACTALTTEPASLTVSTSDWIEMTPPPVLTLPGEQVTIPISISGLNGALIDGFIFTMGFDPSQLSFNSYSTAGTLSENWSLYSNETETTVVISGAYSTPLDSDGTLIELNFDVNPAAPEGSCSEITLDEGQLNEGEYCVAPARGMFCGCLKGDVTQNGTVTSTDATQVLRHMVGATTAPTTLSTCNADTTCNGAISALDAVRIQEYTVGQLNAFCAVSVSSWTGDVTVTLPDQTLTDSGPLSIPLVLDDTTGLEIKGVVFTLDYDPERLLITDIDPTGSLLADLDWMFEINSSQPGQVTVAAAGFTALTGSGTLLNLVGTVRHWGETELTVTQLDFNEGQPTAVLTDTPTKYTVLGFAIEPPAVALGLDNPQLEVVEVCCGEMELVWRHPELDLVLPGNPLILNPPPLQSTYYEARITNPITLATLVRRAQVLVPVYPFTLDYNGDGYNSLEDLYMLLPDWGQVLAIDPNGDGSVDIRDLLYINVSDD